MTCWMNSTEGRASWLWGGWLEGGWLLCGVSILREEIQLKNSGHIAFTVCLTGPVWCERPAKHNFRQEVGTAAKYQEWRCTSVLCISNIYFVIFWLCSCCLGCLCDSWSFGISCTSLWPWQVTFAKCSRKTSWEQIFDIIYLDWFALWKKLLHSHISACEYKYSSLQI